MSDSGGISSGPTFPDIQITREMIAAGVAALPFIDPTEIGSMSEETLVCRVYQATVGVER